MSRGMEDLLAEGNGTQIGCGDTAPAHHKLSSSPQFPSSLKLSIYKLSTLRLNTVLNVENEPSDPCGPFSPPFQPALLLATCQLCRSLS